MPSHGPPMCAAAGKDGGGKKSWFDWYFQSRKQAPQALARTTPMRIEPKTFFANERTFLSWLHMAITIGSISAALLGFAGQATKTKEKTRVCPRSQRLPGVHKSACWTCCGSSPGCWLE